MKRAGNKSIKIVAATAVTIFSLLSLFSGVFAWFVAAAKQNTSQDHFQVTTLKVDIDSIGLYKFEYGKTTVGTIDIVDYLTPETGTVEKYGYNETEGTFGYEDGDDWVDVDVMNLYDPVDQIISHHSLKDMNCNVVFEVSFSSDYFSSSYANVMSARLTSKTKGRNQIFLTDCADFDVFTETDLADSNPLFSDGEGDDHLYYPSYINHRTAMVEPSKTYYKCSYLSSIPPCSTNHTHYYGGQNKPESIVLATNKSVTFVDGEVKLYINVNYAPNELAKYASDIYTHNILAVYDFTLEFSFSNEASS